METLEALEKINRKMDTIETGILFSSNLKPKEKDVPQADVNCKSRGDVGITRKKPDTNLSTEHDKSKTPHGTSEKENDEWEVVESADESEESSNSNYEYEIIVPLKVYENTESNVPSTASVVPMKTSSRETQVDTHVSDKIAIGLDSEKNHQSVQFEPNVLQNEKKNTHSQPPKSKVVKKRRIRLYTGDSSDEDVITKGSGNNKNVNERENKTNENAQNTLQSQKNIPREVDPQENNPMVSKSNVTFTKDNPKMFHSDTEIIRDDDVSKKNPSGGNYSKASKLCNVIEIKSDDEDIIEVPRSPPANNSNYHMIHSRKKTHSRDKSSDSHDYHCNTGSLLSSPNSRRAKRQKLMQQMWKERERKLKLKMVKKLKDVVYQVLESMVSSSDESVDYSVSEDEEMHSSKMVMKRKQQCNKECCAPAHQFKNNESENIRDLKRELQYWKNKAKNETEVLSPRELQIREMKEDLNYWKQIVTSKSVSHDMPNSSHSIPRTSTPEKEDDILSEISMPRPHEISRVTSSADITSHIPQSKSQSKPADYTSEEVLVSTRDKHKSNSFSGDFYKPSHSTEANRALNVMSRTKFTEKEKDQIVEYLVAHYDRLELVKGNMFWMQMAHDLDTHRSWHSLKNNFFQNIIKNLEQYEMPSKVRNKIIGLAKHYI